MDYNGPIEAVLSTDLRGEPYNFALWDMYTGTQLVMFKGNKNNPVPNCLQLIDNNYFITASDNVLQIWSIFNRKCQDQKLFLPKRPSSLCVSPCGNYVVAGISEAIYVWQLHSGDLVAHTQRHYQAVSVLKMNQEGTFLISAGEDGLVLVWPFADLISKTCNTVGLNLKQTNRSINKNEPRFTWQHHSGHVTDIHITNSNLCVTVSVDMTVNIYAYVSGKRLYNVLLPSPLWSVVMDKNETRVFLGGQDGNVYEMLVSPISASFAKLGDGSNGKQYSEPVFKGHKGKIISLIVSADGSRLVSASHDSSCKIWDIRHKKLLQDIKHQAPLANMISLLVPDGLALSSMTLTKPPLSVKPLKRALSKRPRETTLTSEDLFEEASTTVVYVKNKYDLLDLEETHMKVSSNQVHEINGIETPAIEPSSSDQNQVQFLKKKIRDLYLLSAEKIFRDSAEECLRPYKEDVEITCEEPGRSAKKRQKLNNKNTPKLKRKHKDNGSS